MHTARNNASGLYQRLHQLYYISEEAPTQPVAEVKAFWQHVIGIRRDRDAMPCLGWGKGGFTLPGYTNSPAFGHADYCLKLHSEATL